VSNADNCGECLHTSKITQGPQRGAKKGLHGGEATPSNRIRSLHKRETSAEAERLAKVCNKLQTKILRRIKLQQSSSKGFPLETGLIFGTDE
jgi:hypothetical protein